MKDKNSSPRPPKKRASRPSGVSVRMTKRRGMTSITLRAHGPDAPDLRTVLPDLFATGRAEPRRPDIAEAGVPNAPPAPGTEPDASNESLP